MNNILPQLCRHAWMDENIEAAVHAIAAHYIVDYGTDAQKRRWLPRLAAGELLAGIALTESGCGSDLKALRTKAPKDGDHCVIDGAKTFITNGCKANLRVVAVRTGGPGGTTEIMKDLIARRLGA